MIDDEHDNFSHAKDNVIKFQSMQGAIVSYNKNLTKMQFDFLEYLVEEIRIQETYKRPLKDTIDIVFFMKWNSPDYVSRPSCLAESSSRGIVQQRKFTK